MALNTQIKFFSAQSDTLKNSGNYAVIQIQNGSAIFEIINRELLELTFNLRLELNRRSLFVTSCSSLVDFVSPTIQG